MPILKLEFEDVKHPWHLLPVAFDDFNLLVGLSGVGKTRTLRLLNRLGQAARGTGHDLGDCQWTVEVETSAGTYAWRAKTEADASAGNADDEDDDAVVRVPARSKARFVAEEVVSEAGAIVARRTADELSIQGQAVPRLRSRDSIISLIDEEPILSLRQALAGIHFSRARTERPVLYDQSKLKRLLEEEPSLESLKENRKLDLVTKAYLLRQRFPEQFAKVEEQLIDIFGTIEQLDVGRTSELSRRRFVDEPFDFLVPAFRERGIDGWVDAFDMSSGMHRTLLHLLELHLEPPGSVLLVDEYENGMGVNCLPQVTDTLFERRGEVQLVFTSHHPYVINNVPKEQWRIMRRRGHEVEVLRKGDVARLDTASEIDSFVQLINAPEFTEGLA